MSIRIRPATPADAAVISDFNERMALETEAKTLDPRVVAAGVAAVLGDPAKGAYYVAENGAEVLGQLMITREWSDWRNAWIWWIQSVYVRPEARRQGVFRGLYGYAYELARRDPGVIGLRLYVEKNNLTAQRTYAELGMEPMPFLLFQRWWQS